MEIQNQSKLPKVYQDMDFLANWVVDPKYVKAMMSLYHQSINIHWSMKSFLVLMVADQDYTIVNLKRDLWLLHEKFDVISHNLGVDF